MADLSKTIKGGLSAVRNLTRSADEKLEAQRLAREAANPPIKASEAYGRHEGSYLKPIFYDRMKVDLSKGKFGGPGFSGIQLVDPNYANAKAVAGVTDQKMATRILNRNKALVPKDAKVIWTPSVGGLEQHKSNSTMFGEFADIFANQRKNMSAEEIQKLSDRASMMTDNNGRLIFPNGIDLGARNFRQQVKTYDQRALMADIFAGRGVGGEKGRTVPVEELLEKNLDPNMANAGTLDLGNRLFRLEGDVIDRPDLHSDYRKILTGEDLDVNYLPVPIRDVYADWEAQKALELAAQGKNRAVTLMDYTKNDPTVQLTEELLTKMQKAGHKKGGAIDIKASDARLAQAIASRMAKGGEVDIDAADARLADAINARTGMADGGAAGFKKIQFMQAGGIAKGAAKGFKKLFSDRDVLPLAESKIVQPPSIIIPSKVSNVKEAIRQSKGEYGARRVERAADEIPNLDKLYKESALIEAFGGDNAKGLMTVNPKDFENYAIPLQPRFTDKNSTRYTTSGERLDYPEYMSEYLPNVGAFNDVPFLEINKKRQGSLDAPFISGHEGRHRSRVMAGRGDKASLVRLLPRSELREPFPRRHQDEYIEALREELGLTDNMVLPEQYIDEFSDKTIKRPAVKLLDVYAEGGSAFKTLQWQEPQHFDGGGIASPEEGGGYSPESFFSGQRWKDIKKNASEMFAEGKQSLASDYERLKSSPRARAQLAKIAAAQLAGGVPDLAHLGIDLIVDPLKSVTVDKLLTKPAYRSVLEGPPKAGEKQERVPMFGSLSESLKTADGLPIGGSEHMIKRAQDAGLMSQGRFSPLTEIPAAIAGGVGVSKLGGLGKSSTRGYQTQIEPRINPAGALSRSINQDLDKLLPLSTNNPLFTPNPVKLSGLQPEVKTASTGTPKGATYATRQEGPFYRVSPTSLDVSGAKSRGLREANELPGQAPVGGTAGEAGSQVPLRISDEEVARLIADPASNQPLQIAQRFTKDTQGTDFVVPEIPESSLAKQSAIGRAHQLAVEGSPEYKSAVFDAYAREMPDLLEQVGAKSYDDLMEKAYRQLAKETDEQFQRLPYNFSYHRAGEGDYRSSREMMADVHGNKHLYVFQGGDPHDFLNRLDKATGLNENEKFRAVHDLLGHAIYGNQFGPRGEEVAWAIHQQMYSPLARLAMTAETRGQNSLVNYSPLNVKLKENIAKLEDLEVEALRRKDTALVDEIRAAKRQEFASNFQFAPQKAVLLPPEFVNPGYAGGLPDYLSAANRPAKGTETQSVLTHFSHSPKLQVVDPTRYGTGIKGAEAERLRDYAGGVRDRSYFYLGEPGAVAPEPGLGINRYRGESSSLYDITKDPLGFRSLARESNRVPFTAKYNAGITSPLQEANDYERLVKEYGYEGMINPNASKPMSIMFRPTPVQPRKRGGLTQLK